MARVALLIGTGEYTDGFKPLSAAPKDVEAIAAVLRDPEMGGFDQVEPLINQPHTTIAETIETWFRSRQKDDLALLYISGHGVKDAQSDLYFAACNTRKQKEELVRSTAVAASFVRDRIRESKAKRQVIILDCCFSGAFGDLLSKDDDTINLETLLGAEGRVVLTSSSSIQYSFEQRDGGLSIYTRYLVEGIRTGAADIDGDGAISVQELHHYASRKVQEESPAMTPKIIVLKDEGYQIRIAKTPLGDPKVKYRKEAEAIVQEDGDTIDEIFSRPVLEEWQRKLGLTDAEVQTIETEILEPIRQRQAKIQRYQEVFTRAIQHKNPLGELERKRLKQLQQLLGLLDENVQWVEQEALKQLEHNLAQSPDDLSSEKGIDYTTLRDLLKAQDWKAADRETYRVMIRAVGKEEGKGFTQDELLNFPCTDLKTIDALWVKYSKGHFGFSVQKKIYVECGGKLNGEYPGDEIWEKFGDRVGWRKDGQWLNYSDLNPSLSSPQGNFPPFVWWVVLRGGSGFLFSRIETCEL
ncbi:caspase, EACC1-associated type [Pantanalinema rosaneae CENA516]|uniref:caspase, EACC1-associated type n=1 Tax=Pantanalinema rosaneae TaxID=1620701 RepID=UPI003D70127D